MSQTFGTITGRLEDSSTARIPGVSITVTSPAIQGQRDTVSDEGGNYRFANLPIGTYTVKYELPGFKTMVRQDIIVQGGITVTLNQLLEVATVAETVTVTGESPVVDLEQAKIGVNFGSIVKDNVVNARNYWALLSQAPGMITTTPDVGGSTMGTQVGYRAYGYSGQVQVYLDGVNLTEGVDSGSMYGDYGSWEEVNVSAAGNGPEMRSAGASVSAVLRSGTNNFHGSILGAYESGHTFKGHYLWNANNFTDELKAQGLTTGDAFTHYDDFNADIGGPIKKDKATFYSSFRNEYSGLSTNMRQPGGKLYVLPASGIAPKLCDALPCSNATGTPDGAPTGGIFFSRLTNLTTKLTYQLNSTNQLSASGNIREKFQPYRGGSGSNAKNFNPDSTQQQQSWFHIFDVVWTSTINNRTTLNVSLNNFGYYWVNLRNTDTIRINDRGTSGITAGYTQGAYIQDLNNNRRWHEDAVFSHFFDAGGTHNLKVGYEYLWEDYRGSDKGYPNHILYGFNAGAPERITVYNTPVQWQQYGNTDSSIFISDKYQPNRKLTLNLGLRFDRYDSFLARQVRESAGSNPFNQATDIPGLESFGNKEWARRDVGIFNKPVPRVSFIYDMFGNGKTAVKGSFGIFTFNPGQDLASNVLDNNVRSTIYNWNGMLPMATPADLRACLAANACSVNSRPNLALPTIASNLDLPKIFDYTFGIDHELVRDFNLRFNFVRKIQHGNYNQINTAYGPSDYTQFQFIDPLTSGGVPAAGDPTITAWSRNVSGRADVLSLVYDPAGGSMFRTWEIEGVKRMSHKWLLITGADWTKRDIAPNTATTDPNVLFGQNIYPASHYWQWSGKGTLTYQAPWGINISSVLKTQKGEPSVRTVTVNCNRLVPAGQTCAQAGGAAPGQGSTFNVTVEQSGSGNNNFYPTLNLWDMSVGRTFKLAEKFGKIEGKIDISNILNSNTILGWKTTTTTTSFSYVDPNGTTVTKTNYPTNHQPTSILQPRIFRLGLRYTF